MQLVKISFRNESEIKLFSNEGNQRECVVSRLIIKAQLMTFFRQKGNYENQEK